MTEGDVSIDLMHSYALCMDGKLPVSQSQCNYKGWPVNNFTIDGDPKDKRTWGSKTWMFRNYDIQTQCADEKDPSKKCCLRLRAKSPRTRTGVSDYNKLPISITSYDEGDQLYYSPILCDENLKIFPAWFLESEDKSLRILCTTSTEEINELKHNGTMPAYMDSSNDAIVEARENKCYQTFFSNDYTNILTIIISVLVAVLALSQLIYEVIARQHNK